MDMNLSKLWVIVKDRESWCDAVYGVAKSWLQLGNWTTTINTSIENFSIKNLKNSLKHIWASLVAQTVMNLPAM